MSTCNTLNVNQYKVSQLSSYSTPVAEDFLLVIQSGSNLYSRKTSIGELFTSGSGITASYAVSASRSITSLISTQSSFATSASYAKTASYTSLTSSYALSSSHALTSSYSFTSSYVKNAITSSYVIPSTQTGGGNYVLTSKKVLFDIPYSLVTNLSPFAPGSSINNIKTSDASTTMTPNPSLVGANWEDINITTAVTNKNLSTSGIKSAIINVYHPNRANINDRLEAYFGLFSTHDYSTTIPSGKYIRQDIFRMMDPGSSGINGYYMYSNVLVCQVTDYFKFRFLYMLLGTDASEISGTNTSNLGLNIDLIGVEY